MLLALGVSSAIAITLFALRLAGREDSAEPASPRQSAPGAGELEWSRQELSAIRGATVGPIENSLFPGRGYGTPSSAALLDELSRQGMNWVSITPFGRIWSLSSTEIQMDFEAPYEDNRRAIREVVSQAHARGIRVLIIPHLWVVTPGLWRGEIDPESAEGWSAYHESYTQFVLAWAREAQRAGADAFSIGVECKSWSGRFGGVWTQLIERVRGVFDGFLTYSANWDEVRDVLFWDQLDLIGINAFYPLADHEGATDQEYEAGAIRARDRVAALAQHWGRPVLFAEVGYTTRANAAVRPWVWPDGLRNVEIDEHEQARALRAVLSAFASESWFVGYFVWRYYADLDDVSQEAVWGFSPYGKEAEGVLRWANAQRFGVESDRFVRVELPSSPLAPWWAAETVDRWIRSTVVDRPVSRPLAAP